VRLITQVTDFWIVSMLQLVIPRLALAEVSNKVQAPSSAVDVIMCLVRRSMVAGRRLAMNSVPHGWFFDNKEWIVFIIATVLLWLLMMTGVHELDLRSAG
jgi:hypothetical protein